MSEQEELKKMSKDMSKALEKDTDAPRLSIDPETQKASVVGDANALPEEKGTYKLIFGYPPEQVSEEDKLRMKLHAGTGYYLAEVTYRDIFIKPLHRAKITEIMTRVLADANIIDLQGFTSEVQEERFGAAFLKHNEGICEVIHLMLKVPEEQIEYLMPLEPGKFVVQLFQNEPNLIKEANNFLS